MLVSALMLSKDKLFTVRSDDSLDTALTQIKDNDFLSMPVVDDKKFIGVISKGKIFEGFFGACGDTGEYLKSRKVDEFIMQDIPVVSPLDQIEKAAEALQVWSVPFVAVINDLGEFEGIVTHYTIFKVFSDVLGLNKGKRLDVVTHEMKGQIEKLCEVIHRNNGNILSFVILDPEVLTGVKEIVVRIETENYDKIVKDVEAAGFRVL